MRAAATMRTAAAAAGARRKRPRLLSSSSSGGSGGGGGGVRVVSPPLAAGGGGGVRERPTPVLLLELGGDWPSAPFSPSASLSSAAFVDYFTQRGCTVGTLRLDNVNTDTDPSHSSQHLLLDECDARVAGAGKAMGMGPPVVVAAGVGAFLLQKHLESHAAAGLALLDPWPPAPAAVARCFLLAAKNKAPSSSSPPPPTPGAAPDGTRPSLSPFVEALAHAAAQPANALNLEPHAAPLLLLHSAGVRAGTHPWLTWGDVKATAAFHGLELEVGEEEGDVRALPPGGGPVDVARAVYEWYDERF